MKRTAWALGNVAAFFLVFCGIYEWGTQSQSADSWWKETSFAALQLRAAGKLKIGLGLGLLAFVGLIDPKKDSSEDPSGPGVVDPLARIPRRPTPAPTNKSSKIKYGERRSSSDK